MAQEEKMIAKDITSGELENATKTLIKSLMLSYHTFFHRFSSQ